MISSYLYLFYLTDFCEKECCILLTRIAHMGLLFFTAYVCMFSVCNKESTNHLFVVSFALPRGDIQGLSVT